jgi:predicted small lipoprotein YifL
MKTILRLLLLTALLGLAACGNKGSLVLPDKPALHH